MACAVSGPPPPPTSPPLTSPQLNSSDSTHTHCAASHRCPSYWQQTSVDGCFGSVGLDAAGLGTSAGCCGNVAGPSQWQAHGERG